MTARRSLLLAGYLLVAATVVPGLAATADIPADFIRALAKQALEIIGGAWMMQQKMEFFRALLRQDFDLDGIARFTLGRYWPIATAAERQEFRRLIEDYLLITYGQRLQQIGGGTLRVGASRPLPGGGVLVPSEIVREGGGPPMRLDWRLGVHQGVYKIEDLSIDGVSMAISHRAEFGAAIQRGGGSIAGLLATMREAVAPAQFAAPTSPVGVGATSP